MASRLPLFNLTAASLLVVAMPPAVITVSAGENNFSDIHEGKVRRLLKQLNKPAVKSIESPDGDIIDCVPIKKQIAFDHPLLQNHTIQMRPSCHPEGDHAGNAKKNTKPLIQLWHVKGKCPKNTVPIKRTKKEDLLGPTSFESFGKKSQKSIPQTGSNDPFTGHEHSIAFVANDKFYGSKSMVNIWNPFVQLSSEFSLAQTWVRAGDGSDLNTIEAGWQVYPDLYRDFNTRLFVYWTRDGYQKTGCYNHVCPGFVQTNNGVALGGSISPTSIYGGTQYEYTILIWKDKASGNWWLQVQGINVGYWPGTLFTGLADSATRVDWGGEIVNRRTNGKHTSTDMGSGRFAEEGFGKAAYFRNIQIVDGSNTLQPTPGLAAIAEQPNCYDVQLGTAGTSWDSYFYYGGSGLNPNCP
ncbi:PREDICTED: uncharacterized protein LOC104802521 [Tarenaya hassleriana]|uniref:uncharacterized protein LOC104802521 n=1 Tax=Tarenaya hassleriana TaxID=28532 RepID=UPI00053C7E16|nr:PREDICTED: uncharacterized protein LOC104802521 [Tarenaya hassleriana]